MGKSAAHGNCSWGKSLMQMENTYATSRIVLHLAATRGRNL